MKNGHTVLAFHLLNVGGELGGIPIETGYPYYEKQILEF